MKKLKHLLLVLTVGLVFVSFINSVPEPKVGLNIGDKVPDLKSSLLNGSEFDLQSLKGKMVLIDFWASYDGNSRVENHQKMILQKKFANSNFYKGEGFVIVSISLDRFKSPLAKAIKEDDFSNALHICDYKGAKSPLAKTFKVKSPINYLIDGEGRLVARSAGIEKVASSLEYLQRN
jgi:thiol-disulfide isomerase/thioredoxin